MNHEELLARINFLAKKSKEEGLTPEEKAEQKDLRQAYLKGFRSQVKSHIEGMKIVDEEGNDLTPEKLKAIQKEKGLHNRHLEEDE